MKIMDASSDDGECQVEAVVNAKTKKTKQAKSQTLKSVPPINKKKRKSALSPDVRNPKVAKVDAKENDSSKKSNKTDIEEITIDDDDEDVKNEKEKKTAGEADKSNNGLKESNKTSTKKKPGKLVKGKKLDSKVQMPSLTKFFKKLDDKDKKQTDESKKLDAKSDESKKETVNNSKTQKKSKNCNYESSQEKKENIEDNKSNKNSNDTFSQKKKENIEENKFNENSNDSSSQKKKENIKENKSNENSNDSLPQEKNENIEENKSSESSNDTLPQKEKNGCHSKDNEEEEEDHSEDDDSADSTSSDEEHINEKLSVIEENKTIDLDSDVNMDDDSSSDTDKRTEYEDTDSRDDINKNTESKSTLSGSKPSSAVKSKKLTPKQLEKKLESAKKREMREKQRFEREKKLQEEREMRKKEKEDKKREREEKDKALKEQKRKDKESKEQKKQAELEQKQKEKEAKEEDRRKREEAKEEEKKRKEEEKLEAERKKQKAASNFVSFFVSKKTTETKTVAEEEVKVVQSNFMPFEVKSDMRTAPVTRRNLTDKEKSELRELISKGDKTKSELYIEEIKSKKTCIRKSERTWPSETSDDVVIIEEEEKTSESVVQAGGNLVKNHRAKLLLFSENRRPPYWGTWSKKSKSIGPRRPFATDTKWFDYEVDSDDEWEEEEPGESLRGSDDEKEEDPEDNEYDVDNDFMVPHGYLSEEEIMADEEEGDEDDDINPERQKTKLEILNKQFEAERKQKTTKLHPKVIGCLWLKADNTYPENTPSSVVRFLTSRQAWVSEIPLSLTAPADGELNRENLAWSAKLAAASAKKAETLEAASPDIIHLLHGNTNNQKFLIKEFIEFWNVKKADTRILPKIRLKDKFRELATYLPCPEAGPYHEKMMWYVPEEVRKKYLSDVTLSLPNSWVYSLTPKKKKQPQSEVKEKHQPSEKSDDGVGKEKEKEKKNTPRITQFTKTLTAEEMQKQLAEKPPTPSASKSVEKVSFTAAMTSGTKATPLVNRAPKRIPLISLSRLELPPKTPRVCLIDKFTKKDSSSDEKATSKPQEDSDDDIKIIEDVPSIVEVTSDKKENSSTNKSKSEDGVGGTKKSDKINKKTGNSSFSDIEVMEI